MHINKVIVATAAKIARTVDKSFTVQPGGSLKAVTFGGSITIKTSDTPGVRVVATETFQRASTEAEADDILKDLDERGIVRIGARVKSGDILVGKITPKGETELSPEEKLELENQVEKLSGKKVRARYTVDRSLLGGALVKLGSTIYDGSVKGQLERIREQLSSN